MGRSRSQLEDKIKMPHKAAFIIRDPVGIRTQDPILKRDVLYLLSYWIKIFIISHLCTKNMA
jgi:hypothetical protein